MQRELLQTFQRGDLTLQSELIEIKYIGPYLYQSLLQEFAPHAQRLTIQQFATRLRRFSNRPQVYFTLNNALENARRRQTLGNGYTVRDHNFMAYKVIVALIKILNDGKVSRVYNFAFGASQLRAR